MSLGENSLRRFVLAALCAVAAIALAAPGAGAEELENPMSEYRVTFDEGVEDHPATIAQQHIDLYGIRVQVAYEIGYLAWDVSAEDVEGIAADPRVKSVEADPRPWEVPCFATDCPGPPPWSFPAPIPPPSLAPPAGPLPTATKTRRKSVKKKCGKRGGAKKRPRNCGKRK